MEYPNRQEALVNGALIYKGKPCADGHSVARYTRTRVCTTCSGWTPTGNDVGQPLDKFKAEAIKNNEKFYFNGKPCKRGHVAKRLTYNSVCVECAIVNNSQRSKDYELIKKYGITEDEYNILLEKQNGKCFICKEPETKLVHKKICRLAVDHCHDTGKVRGLLCYACNVGIGFFKHNSERLRNAALYCEVA